MKYTRFYTKDLPPLLELFDYTKFNSMLDLGAGDGAIIWALHKRGWLPEQVTAVEIDEKRVNKIEELNLGVNCWTANAENLFMLKDNSIDFIVCHQVIEHVENETALIKEAHRVLRKNGAFYLSTVFKKWYGIGYKGGKLDHSHLREYTDKKQLIDKLKPYFPECYEKMSLQWFSITDFILPRLGLMNHIYEQNSLLNGLRAIKLPILGYYSWELVLWRK